MCAGAMLLSRVGALVWGAPNARAGADGSWVALLPPEGSELGHEGPIALPAPLSAPGGQARGNANSSWVAPLPPEGAELRTVLAEGRSEEASPEHAAGSWGDVFPGRESSQRSGEASAAGEGHPAARPRSTAGESALESLAGASPGRERARHDDAAGSIAGWPAASPVASPARAGGRYGSLRASPGLDLSLCSLEASATGSPLEAGGRDGGAASASVAGEPAQPRSSSTSTRACGENSSDPDEVGPSGSGRASGVQQSWRPHPSHPVIQVRLGR